MDVILKVLEGAKAGTKIAVKKDEFVIGRSQGASLCVGSSSVSRKHCAITRHDGKVFIEDLGSRNGTIVNDKKIHDRVELTGGEELSIGSLKLQITLTHGLNNQKLPKVNSVAEAVERTSNTGDSTINEEDITKWLLDAPGPKSQAFSETQTIRMDDTNAVKLKQAVAEQSESDAEKAESSDIHDSSEPSAEPAEDGSAKDKKKKPGKLPKVSSEPASKDSREAAMMALRNWNRRR